MKKILFNILFILSIFCFTGCNSSFQIQVDHIDKTMYVGETIKLTTNQDSLNETGTITYKSSNEEVATVTFDGVVSALKEGEAYISAILNDHESRIYLTVLAKIEYKNTIQIIGQQSVLVNESILLKAIVTPTNTTDIEWTSSDSTIATVNILGEVKGIKPGLVTIRATLENDKSIYQEINVLVRTGSGIQDVIYNYIYHHSHELTGNLDLTSLNQTTTKIVEERKPSILGVINYFNENGKDGIGYGSCVVIEKEVKESIYLYTVLTNYHVIENYQTIKIFLGEDDLYIDAKFIRGLEPYDLALLQFESTKDIECVPLGTEEEIKDGDFVLAIGHPNGFTYYGSITFGMISSKKRTMENEQSIFIQHDAAINQGNSGGALLNLKGELIGINTLKLVGLEIEGMSFAISIETIKDFLNDKL